jgi:hypothetical protein
MCRQTVDKDLKAFNKAIIGVEHKLAEHPNSVFRLYCSFSGLESFNKYWRGVQLNRHNSKSA